MQTNIDIDERTVRQIMKLKNLKTKKEAVNIALQEYLRILSARELLKLKGTGWEGDLEQMRLD